MAKQIKKNIGVLRRGARYAPLLVMVAVAIMVLWPANRDAGDAEMNGKDVPESRELINGRLGLALDQGLFPSDIQGITMPHHLLVAGFMDKF